jgi:hypothetical protein
MFRQQQNLSKGDRLDGEKPALYRFDELLLLTVRWRFLVFTKVLENLIFRTIINYGQSVAIAIF